MHIYIILIYRFVYCQHHPPGPVNCPCSREIFRISSQYHINIQLVCNKLMLKLVHHTPISKSQPAGLYLLIWVSILKKKRKKKAVGNVLLLRHTSEVRRNFLILKLDGILVVPATLLSIKGGTQVGIFTTLFLKMKSKFFFLNGNLGDGLRSVLFCFVF